jgi:hypothetical protein
MFGVQFGGVVKAGQGHIVIALVVKKQAPVQFYPGIGGRKPPGYPAAIYNV